MRARAGRVSLAIEQANRSLLFLFLFIFLYLFPGIKFIYNNKPHIKWIHTAAKHQIKINIFQHDASIIISLGFY
jgi:hypothetical protein